MMKSCLVDCDDLWNEDQIVRHIVPLKTAVPALNITLYGIPNLLGPVHDLRERYPFIVFGIHGFEHTFAECRAWHRDLAKAHIETALEMGFHPVFKPPQWIHDGETELACVDLEVILHHHESYSPELVGLKAYPGWKEDRVEHEYIHTHIESNVNTDFIVGHPKFNSNYLRQFDRFLVPEDFFGEEA